MPTPKIPEQIVVHLGAPDSNAMNVTVSFADYIKNEVLAVEMIVEAGSGDIDLNGHMAALTVCKA